jgi:hypothetical protein
MQTLIYALRVQTTKANACALLEYFDRHSGARALLRKTEWEEIADLIRVASLSHLRVEVRRAA